MQKLLLKLSVPFLMLIFLMNACTPDEGPVLNDPPSISLNSGTDFLTSDATLAGGEAFKVSITAESGTDLLKTITVNEDGAKLSVDRFTVNGSPAAANPLLVVDAADQNVLTWEIGITAQESGTVNYEFVVADEGGLSGAVSLNITVNAEPPKLTIEGDGNFMSAPASLVQINITGEVGSSPINSIAVYEDGVLIDDTERLRIGEATNNFASNPQILEGADKEGFATALFIRSHDGSGARTYTVEIEDEAGAIASQDFTINSGTPIDLEFVAIVVNNSDGPEFGSLDMHAGEAVSINSDQAEIRDMGIDINEPNATNWLRQIRPANGAILRVPDPNQVENFKYENIDTKEAIIAGYDTGTEVSESDPIEIGDLFIVRAGNDYFLMQAANVVLTDSDNLDFYEFNVKQALE